MILLKINMFLKLKRDQSKVDNSCHYHVTNYTLVVVKEEAMQVEESSAAPPEGGAGIQEADNKSAVNRLDELFKKTLATPQIYWLPLTTEEVRDIMMSCWGLLVRDDIIG